MAVSISLAIAQNSQSIANNTSNVTVKVTAKWTYGSYNATGQCTGSITIDGTKYSFSSIKFNTGESTSGSQVIMTKTVDVSHKSDGSKTLSCSASFVTGVSSGTVSCSGSKALTTIPRKSTLSVENGALGVEQTLTVTRQSSSFTHTIVATCGDQSKTICTKSTDTSIEFVPPFAWASENTTGLSVSVEYTITTYNGSTSLGSNSYTKTCTIPLNIIPTVSISVEDAMGYFDTYGGYIQGMSKFKISVSASGTYGSTIKSYKITADGKTYTTASVTTNVISNSGTLHINVTVTDSRGRTAVDGIEIEVFEYTKPKISSLKVYRSDDEGNASSSGAYLTATFGYSITSLNNGNTATIKLQYKKSSETDYSTGTVLDGKCIFEADTTSSYDVLLTVSDNFYSVTKTATGQSITKLFSWFSQTNNNVKSYGWAFGKVAELIGYLDIAFKTMFRDHAYFENNKVIFGTKPGTNERWEALNPCNASGNTVLGYDNYENKNGLTNIYGYDLNFGVSNIASPGTYRPYRRQGDSLTLSLRTAGYVTNSGKDVSFWIPMSVPIIGSPKAVLTSGNGFVLRQGEKYTHGSAADVYVTPESYEATMTTFNGIYVKAVFSDVTNVTNNDTIGIYWNGTITFE